jgi:probable rRNA maturation factor
MLTAFISASSRYPIRRKEIKRTIEKVLSKMNVTDTVQVEINIVGDRKMTSLHVAHLHEEGTTDVMSFPLQENFLKNRGKEEFEAYPDGLVRLGTIVVSYPQAQRQANDHRITIDEEINRLVEHGMLHLLGIHHD